MQKVMVQFTQRSQCFLECKGFRAQTLNPKRLNERHITHSHLYFLPHGAIQQLVHNHKILQVFPTLFLRNISEIYHYLIVPFPPPIPHIDKAELTTQAMESLEIVHTRILTDFWRRSVFCTQLIFILGSDKQLSTEQGSLRR